MTKAFTLQDFVAESNRIEGIHRVLPLEVEAHRILLAAPKMTIYELSLFVATVAGPEYGLREQPGMDVRVGNHYPPRGGPEVRIALQNLLDNMGSPYITPYITHLRYETIHPFIDCNGRSGRVLWLWQMGGIQRAPLGFLHSFYYATLDNIGRG